MPQRIMSSHLTLLYLVIQAEDHAKMDIHVAINASRPCISLDWLFELPLIAAGYYESFKSHYASYCHIVCNETFKTN